MHTQRVPRPLALPIIVAAIAVVLMVAAVIRGGNFLGPSLLLFPVFIDVYMSIARLNRINKGKIEVTSSVLQIMLISFLSSMFLAFAAGIFVAGGLKTPVRAVPTSISTLQHYPK